MRRVLRAFADALYHVPFGKFGALHTVLALALPHGPWPPALRGSAQRPDLTVRASLHRFGYAN